MNIYISHATSFDFLNDLYAPIKNINIQDVNFILPHERSQNVKDSKEAIKTCDAVIAEVSHPSTGMGIELGWANMFGKTIHAIHKEGLEPSSAIKIVTDNIKAYSDLQRIILETLKA